MSTEPYKRRRDFHGDVSGEFRVRPTDSGLIALVPALAQQTIFVQTIHVEVTTPIGGELWTVQDGAGVAIVPNLSAAAVAHFDFDFGPDGVPCEDATRLVLNITGAVGAAGWIAWEAYKRFTLGQSYAQAVLDLAPLGYWRLDERGGTVAQDAIGAHVGTYVGGSALTVGVPPLIDSGGRAMRTTPIDATTIAGVTIANFPMPRFVTIEAIVAPTGTPVALSFPRIWSSSSAIGFPIDLSVDPNIGAAYAFVNCVGGSPSWKQMAIVPQDHRYHLAVTWDEIAFRGFLNGALVFTDTTDAGRPLTGTGVPSGLRYIGCSESGQSFNGVIDELAVYDKPLAASVLAAHSKIAIGI